MRGWWSWTVGIALTAGTLGARAVSAQAAPASAGGGWSDPCGLASNEEFQRIQGVDPRIGIIPDVPVTTKMAWGQHCDYQGGSITLYTNKFPDKDLDGLLKLAEAKGRSPVSGLGRKAFYTVIYPGNPYKEQGLLAVSLDPRMVTFTMDANHGETVDATRPRLETLAKLVLPRLE
jgi:hypothetical protein